MRSLSPANFFQTRRPIALLAAVDRIPTTFALRDYVEACGLMSYGASLPDSYRQLGIYASRILKGEAPADLPIAQLSKVRPLS
jgi:putative tryptophan/tyrosine transport system substrate-binding protein